MRRRKKLVSGPKTLLKWVKNGYERGKGKKKRNRSGGETGGEGLIYSGGAGGEKDAGARGTAGRKEGEMVMWYPV